MSTPAKPETALDIIPKEQSDLMRPDAQASKLSRLAAFTPANLTEAIALARMMAKSNMVPTAFKGKEADILIAMQMGAEVGLAPMAAIQNIAVINGRPSLWGDAALGVVQVHPAYEGHTESMEGEGNLRKAVFKIKRKGQEWHTVTFSVAQAIKAGLWTKSGPWQNYPDRMLQMRARGFGLRDKFSDALRGLILAEEAMDLPVSKAGRESGTLDVAASISDLTPSTEPNRGHSDTGLQRSNPDEQTQPEPKKEPTMCSECQKIDGHEPTCKYFAQAEQDRKTSKGTSKALYLILSVEERKKKVSKDAAAKGEVGAPYLVLNVVTTTTEGDKEGKLYVWNKALHGYLVQLSDKKLVGEVSESEKDGKPFVQLEHILELNGVAFVNDLPAQQGTLEIPAEQSPEEDF